jgi:hypothetical protein
VATWLEEKMIKAKQAFTIKVRSVVGGPPCTGRNATSRLDQRGMSTAERIFFLKGEADDAAII